MGLFDKLGERLAPSTPARGHAAQGSAPQNYGAGQVAPRPGGAAARTPTRRPSSATATCCAPLRRRRSSRPTPRRSPKLTPEQRRKVLADVSAELPPAERATSDDPRSLARMATRAEMRNPGTMERTLGGGRGAGMGMGGMIAGTLLASVAGAFIGTAIADAFFDDETGGDTGGEEVAAEDPGAEDPGADFGGGDFGGDFDETGPGSRARARAGLQQGCLAVAQRRGSELLSGAAAARSTCAARKARVGPRPEVGSGGGACGEDVEKSLQLRQTAATRACRQPPRVVE